MLRTASFMVVAALAFVIAGCASQGERVDPGVEAVASHDFNPTDLQLIGKQAVEKILARDVFKNAEEKLPLYVAPIKNLTDEHVNTPMIQEYIANKFDETGKVRLIITPAEKQENIAELERQQDAFVDPATAQKIGKLIGVKYYVTGQLANMSTQVGSKKGQFFLFTLKLIKVETGDVTTSQVEIQKLSKRGWFGW